MGKTMKMKVERTEFDFAVIHCDDIEQFEAFIGMLNKRTEMMTGWRKRRHSAGIFFIEDREIIKNFRTPYSTVVELVKYYQMERYEIEINLFPDNYSVDVWLFE